MFAPVVKLFIILVPSFKYLVLLHQKKYTMRILLLLSVIMGFISCDTQKDTNHAEEILAMEDTTQSARPASIVSIYLLEELMMPDGTMKEVKDLDITMELQSQNKIMGFSGCNQFHGTYTYESGIFSTSGVASTRKMCKDNMDVEQAVLKYLNTTLTVENTTRGITMSKEDAVVMKLRKIDE